MDLTPEDGAVGPHIRMGEGKGQTGGFWMTAMLLVVIAALSAAAAYFLLPAGWVR